MKPWASAAAAPAVPDLPRRLVGAAAQPPSPTESRPAAGRLLPISRTDSTLPLPVAVPRLYQWQYPASTSGSTPPAYQSYRASAYPRTPASVAQSAAAAKPSKPLHPAAESKRKEWAGIEPLCVTTVPQSSVLVRAKSGSLWLTSPPAVAVASPVYTIPPLPQRTERYLSLARSLARSLPPLGYVRAK